MLRGSAPCSSPRTDDHLRVHRAPTHVRTRVRPVVGDEIKHTNVVIDDNDDVIIVMTTTVTASSNKDEAELLSTSEWRPTKRGRGSGVTWFFFQAPTTRARAPTHRFAFTHRGTRRRLRNPPTWSAFSHRSGFRRAERKAEPQLLLSSEALSGEAALRQ